MLESLRFVIVLVFQETVVILVLNLESVSHVVHYDPREWFRNGFELFLDVSNRSRKDLELFRIDDKLESRDLLHEALQVKSSFVYELLILVTNRLLWWELWNRNSGPIHLQLFSKDIELIEPPHAGPSSFVVDSSALVDNVPIVILGIGHCEL